MADRIQASTRQPRQNQQQSDYKKWAKYRDKYVVHDVTSERYSPSQRKSLSNINA